MRTVLILVFLLLSFFAVSAQEKNKKLNEFDEESSLLYRKTAMTVVAINSEAPAGNFIGSGVIISSDGLVLTVMSVVPPGSRKIEVLLSDGRRFDAKLVGYEERNTVSLIRLKDANNLTYATLGDSDKVKPGSFVISVADVYNSIVNERQPAVSLRTISGIYRLRRGDGHYKGRVLEFDAALNQGSDGGPLFNLKGEVVGLMVLDYSYAKWLGCAIPINQIKYILEDLKQGRRITPRYGLTLEDDPHPDGGVVLKTVERGKPAFQGGLRRGDVVVEFDGERIETPEQLAIELTVVPPGTDVVFTVRRGGELKKFIVSVAKICEEPPKEKVPVTCGIILEEKDGKLLVESVAKDSPAEVAGVVKGDVVVEIDGKEVKRVEDYQRILNDKSPGDAIHFKIQRADGTKDFVLKLVEIK
ncbi:MAG: PDZ domain-containing protein [Planctomycetota bacterium]|nr:PDZ domain-containing protein [Planctomycetota bacterium]